MDRTRKATAPSLLQMPLGVFQRQLMRITTRLTLVDVSKHELASDSGAGGNTPQSSEVSLAGQIRPAMRRRYARWRRNVECAKAIRRGAGNVDPSRLTNAGSNAAGVASTTEVL